ncbi:peptidoglycan/LPS O-acetylase OafA/YrhL [Roseiarcus fermentans]|uniref:Peptidoglycan/LPS O-acetylase OafA/YrhL n=1 Tax=Roseiarcus fermentans TaxID=1473586 RepID=A0A366EQA5_9HYPH|nr:acyltransferase [Roseiarcus fermentans]RBP04568.1 peptidoglycan/LPS O-acetylase OafA/YrhL [Roseiarcus fermentans]
MGSIDGLRGYLALSVLLHHFIMWTLATRLGRPWGGTDINLVNQFGAAAVGLFFMITGLLFYPTIRRGLFRGNWLRLYIRRAFRILPMVAVSVVLVTAVIVLRTGHGLDANYASGALKWITAKQEVDLLGYPNSGRINGYVLWSLHYEWLFYLLVIPLCATAMEFRGRLPTWSIPLGLLVVAIVLRAAAPRMSMFIPLFSVGMLAYELQERQAIREVLQTPAAAALALAALAAGMILFRTPYEAALPLFAFFFACVAAGNSFFGVLALRPSLVLGECSYGIYLVHAIFLSILFVDCRALLDRVPTIALPALLPGVAVVVVLVTSCTYVAVERPAIALGAAVATFAERQAARLPGRKAGALASERRLGQPRDGTA